MAFAATARCIFQAFEQRAYAYREKDSYEIYAVKKICRRVGYHPMAVAMLARDF